MKKFTLATLLLLIGSAQSYGMFSRLRPLARIAPTTRLSTSAFRLGLSRITAPHLISTKASIAKPTSNVWQKRTLMGLAGTMGVVGIALNTQPAKAEELYKKEKAEPNSVTFVTTPRAIPLKGGSCRPMTIKLHAYNALPAAKKASENGDSRSSEAGYVQFKSCNPCRIAQLYIHEAFRNQGYGKELLEEAAKEAKEAGCIELSGYIDPAKIGYYKKLGASIAMPQSAYGLTEAYYDLSSKEDKQLKQHLFDVGQN